jgi:hypothetical protein
MTRIGRIFADPIRVIRVLFQLAKRLLSRKAAKNAKNICIAFASLRLRVSQNCEAPKLSALFAVAQ